jgi:hypothetical protein
MSQAAWEKNQHARRHRWAIPAAAASATTVRRPPARITPDANAMNNSCVERRRNIGANSASRPARTLASVPSPTAASVDTPIIGGVQNTTDAAPLNDHPRSELAAGLSNFRCNWILSGLVASGG